MSSSERQAIRSPPMPAPLPPIRVNRAPLLTLWATVVAEPLGHLAEAALTLGGIIVGTGRSGCKRPNKRAPGGPNLLTIGRAAVSYRPFAGAPGSPAATPSGL